MNRISSILVATCSILLAFGGAPSKAHAAQSSAFTYQGRLTYQGDSYNGAVDLRFSLYDALSGGNQLGNTITNTGVFITNGLFTVTLDFGSSFFTGADRWLGIAVGNDAEMTPRQPLSPAPYAVYAASAASASAYGGSITDTQLSSNIPRLDADQTFTGSNVFTGTVKSISGTDEYYMVPKGGIIIWSGSEAAIPSGWALCDGTSGTPDLRNRFVVGAGTGSSYAVADTGGASSHTHDTAIGTPTTSSAGAHTHTTATGTTGSESGHTHSIDPPSTTTSSAGAHTHGGGTLQFSRGVDVVGSGSGGTFSISLTTGTGANFLSPNVGWGGATASGGSHTHTLDIAPFTSAAGSAHSHSIPALSTDSQGAHTHTVSIGTITSTSADSRPPYYALCYIMKL